MKEIIISCNDVNVLNDAIRQDINQLRRTNIDFKVSLRESKIYIPTSKKTIIYATLENTEIKLIGRRNCEVLYSHSYNIEEIIKESE